MKSGDISKVEQFLEKWDNSQGNERANCQPFFLDLCDLLGVKRPDPKGSVEGDPYCFEKDIEVISPKGKSTANFIDFYKENHFVVEAKQGSNKTAKGTGKRGTASYLKVIREEYHSWLMDTSG